MKPTLYGKTVLFIGAGLYDYEKSIIQVLENAGACVTFYFQQPIWCMNTVLYNFSKLAMIQDQLRDQHQKNILKSIGNKKYDYFFLIHGAYLKEWFIASLREKLQNTKFIMYQWDSLSTIPNVMQFFSYFNTIFSFDKSDCDNHTSLRFRPLFFRENKRLDNSYQYDLAFIGSLHSNRLEIIQNIEKIAFKQKWSSYFYLYCGPGLRTYLKHCLSRNVKNIHVKTLKYNLVQSILHSSKAIIDLHNPAQTGLTMRTIEALSQGKKIITSNHAVKTYDFFCDENIKIIDEKSIEIENDFIQSDFKDIPLDILRKYSLTAWIDDIFYITS